MLYRVEALVIRSTDYGEGNKIITLFTEAYGKIGVMARGARKPTSRLSAVAQPFTYGEFVFFRVGTQLGTLNHAEMIRSHQRLREDVLLSAYASYLTEMTDRLIGDNEPQAYIYRQLNAAYTALTDGKDPQIISHIYEMKILAAAGYAPSLTHCAECGEPTDHTVFSFQAGGLLCSRCAGRDREAVNIGETGRKLLRLFEAVDLERLGSIDVKPETKERLKSVMRGWIDTHVNVKWRSRSVMEQMEKYGI